MGRKAAISIVIAAALFSSVRLGADSFHVMEAGDTLYSLSVQFGVSVDELLDANGISDPSTLSIGTRLRIPVEGTVESDSSVWSTAATYTVRKGDTYYGIARSHGMAVERLLELNSRDGARVLRVGETLVISPGNRDSSTMANSTTTPVNTVVSVDTSSSSRPTRVSNVPWWPVAGMKSPLNGRLVGVAIEADPRSYVHAVATGNVVWTGPYRGFGHVVLVDSNGYIYLYGGNEDLFVNVGQTVAAGSRIGRLGPSGPDGGSREMIFSVFREGVPVSPDEAPRG